MVHTEQSRAVKTLLSMIASCPGDVTTYCKLAVEYESAGEYQKANLTLRRALEIDPFHHQGWLQLGIHEMNRGRWRSGADAFERAAAIAPLDVSSWIGYGMALIAAHDLRAAVNVRDILMERFPQRAETQLIAGHIAKIKGQFANAAACYRRVLDINPEHPEALFNLVDLSPPAPEDPLTQRLESLARAPSLARRDSTIALFSLGRIYERAGRCDQAFACYRDANAASAAMMRGSGNAYDPASAEEQAAHIIELFGPQTMAHRLEPLDLDVRPIFIVGLPRSGTTLIERILSNHSQVAAGGELPFMQECLATLRRATTASQGAAANRWSAAPQRRLLVQLRNEYLDRLFELELDAQYVTDKLPANFAALGLIRLLFPHALIVHSVRDPIATCWSLYSTHFDAHLSYNTSFEHLAHYYKNVYLKLMRHWSGLEGLDIISVEYEALVGDPERAIRDLLQRCRLPYEARCLDFKDNDQPIYTASAAQARQPIYATSMARWRHFEHHLGALIAAFGPPASPL